MFIFTTTNCLNPELRGNHFSKSNYRGGYSRSKVNSYSRCFSLNLSRVKSILSKSNVIFSSSSIRRY